MGYFLRKLDSVIGHPCPSRNPPFHQEIMLPDRGETRTERTNKKVKKVQARGLLGGQGPDYCQACTDTIQATSHV